jgi:hypothetical protein
MDLDHFRLSQFAGGSHLPEIRTFLLCKTHRRFQIPVSVEILGGFNNCHSLTQVIFQCVSPIQKELWF